MAATQATPIASSQTQTAMSTPSPAPSSAPLFKPSPGGNITAPYFDPNGSHPVHYGLVLFPGYQIIDAFGPVDVFNSLSFLYNFPMKLSVLAATNNLVSTKFPYDIPANMTHRNPLTQFDHSVVVDRTFSEQLKIQGEPKNGTYNPDAIDVLIVPGGAVRKQVEQEIAFVKAMYPQVKAILSICTGATLLARGGVLDGRRATTNKAAWKWATSTGPNVNWVGEARWVVDGNIITSSGISSGTDAAYAFVGMNYGKKVEEDLAKRLEYNRWENSTYDPFSHIWNVTESGNSL